MMPINKIREGENSMLEVKVNNMNLVVKIEPLQIVLNMAHNLVSKLSNLHEDSWFLRKKKLSHLISLVEFR